MKDFLEFTFQSFWHWAGVLILLTAPVAALGNAIGEIRRSK